MWRGLFESLWEAWANSGNAVTPGHGICRFVCCPAAYLWHPSCATGQRHTGVSFIRTEPGMFEEYLRYLASTYKKLMEEQKKQGTITDYAVYEARLRDPQDADLILTVTYKNMAAFDGLQARIDPVVKQIFGSLPKAASASADRGKMRKEIGSQMVRQLILK
jgi:hypothetical protein